MREKLVYLLAAVAAALLTWNLYKIAFVLPAEANVAAYQIVYFHVPAAFTALCGFFVALGFSGTYLATGNLKFDNYAAGVTEVALAFATVRILALIAVYVATSYPAIQSNFSNFALTAGHSLSKML